MAFHGTADPIVAYPLVRGCSDVLGGARGCAPAPSVTRIGSDIQVRTFTGCRAGLSVVFYTVEGGGHTWPDGLVDLPAFGRTTRTIDATDLILAFGSQAQRVAPRPPAAGSPRRCLLTSGVREAHEAVTQHEVEVDAGVGHLGLVQPPPAQLERVHRPSPRRRPSSLGEVRHVGVT